VCTKDETAQGAGKEPGWAASALLTPLPSIARSAQQLSHARAVQARCLARRVWPWLLVSRRK